MKKLNLKAFLVFLLACAGTALFSYSFPPFKVVIYGISAALWGISVLLFGLLYQKAKNNKKPVLKAIIFTAASLAVIFGLIFLINNIILNAKNSTLSAEIITGIVGIFFTLTFVLVLKAGGKKAFPAALSLLLVVAVGYAPIAIPAAYDYRLKHAEPQAAPTNLSTFTEKKRELIENADFYVAPDGNDGNDGSLEKPFATIEKARDTVRSLDKTGRNGITVAVKAGEYRVDSLSFTAADSGTEKCPVAYRAYGDGEVILNGGVTLKPDSFKAVADESMLGRLSDEAKKRVLCADLKEYGLTAEDWGKIYPYGSHNTNTRYDGDWVGDLYCELFINDKRQALARYPDADYLYTGKVIDAGYGKNPDGSAAANWEEVRNPPSDVYEIDRELADRISSWKTLDDVWMFGFWTADWADASTPIGAFSAEKLTLSPKFAGMFGAKKDAPYYFFNVFEELDAPGEWYLDRENGIVYVYPDSDLSSSSIDISVTVKPVINAENVSYLTFDGFTLKGTRGNAIVISGKNNTVENCLIKNVAGDAIHVDGYDNLVYSNEITRTGKGGIYLNGGDRETLTPGNNKADNNYIHDWSEITQTYQPACSLGGVGNICSHNEMHDSPHEAITYGGNNHIIEYNNIHDVCLLTDDAGAIYAGRRWDFYGTVIRYNAVYDLGSDGHRPCGIYMDDALSGQTIYGNLLVNVPSIALHLGGGRDLQVYNNIVVNTNDSSISYVDRAREGVVNNGWFSHSRDKEMEGGMWQLLFESPWQTDVWKEAYPQMQKFSDDFNDTDNPDFVPNPAYSNVNKNIIVNIPGTIGKISDSANRFSNVTDNAVYKMKARDDIFEDAANGNYTLKNIPDGFEQIPFDKIGRY